MNTQKKREMFVQQVQRTNAVPKGSDARFVNGQHMHKWWLAWKREATCRANVDNDTLFDLSILRVDWEERKLLVEHSTRKRRKLE
jgi:hypothetical protein